MSNRLHNTIKSRRRPNPEKVRYHNLEEGLQNAGYSIVRRSHLRYNNEGQLMPRRELKEISNFGGFTELVLEKDGKRAVGTAECSSEDNFCKAVGNYIALKRAWRTLNG